jgi:hypothetical protein
MEQETEGQVKLATFATAVCRHIGEQFMSRHSGFDMCPDCEQASGDQICRENMDADPQEQLDWSDT